eukprot:gene16344-biopygen6757
MRGNVAQPCSLRACAAVRRLLVAQSFTLRCRMVVLFRFHPGLCFVPVLLRFIPVLFCSALAPFCFTQFPFWSVLFHPSSVMPSLFRSDPLCSMLLHFWEKRPRTHPGRVRFFFTIDHAGRRVRDVSELVSPCSVPARLCSGMPRSRVRCDVSFQLCVM